MTADPSTQSDTRSILLADDNEELRGAVGRALAGLGYRIIEARDGMDLHRRVTDGLREGTLPDLILSDIRMPWTSGLLVLERLRRGGCAVPVILMTAFADAETDAQVRRLGGLLLGKPFKLHDLQREVSGLLGCAAQKRRTAP